MKIAPVVIIDSREQTPWVFHNLPSCQGTLSTADYSILHLEHLVGIERKTLADFVACCGYGRERFSRELLRLQGLRFRAVFLECTLADIEAGNWRGKMKPSQILGAIASWSTKYTLPVFFAGDHGQAGRFAERFLYHAARHIAEDYSVAAELVNCAEGTV